VRCEYSVWEDWYDCVTLPCQDCPDRPCVACRNRQEDCICDDEDHDDGEGVMP
jgi:hypothetical protein